MSDQPSAADDQALLQEAVFQSLLRKIPEVRDMPLLRETAAMAMKMLLRRTKDQHLIDDLNQQINDRIKHAEAVFKQRHDPAALQEAAKKCAEILKTAGETRRPREAVRPRQSADSYERMARGASHPVHKEKPASHWPRYAAAVAIIGLAAAGAFTTWPTAQKESKIHPLVQQFEDALSGTAPPSNLYGGKLEVVSRQGKKAVIATEVPPAECVAAGWQLSHHGLVIVNDQPLARPSAVTFSQYCRETEDPVTLEWRPKAEK